LLVSKFVHSKHLAVVEFRATLRQAEGRLFAPLSHPANRNAREWSRALRLSLYFQSSEIDRTNRQVSLKSSCVGFKLKLRQEAASYAYSDSRNFRDRWCIFSIMLKKRAVLAFMLCVIPFSQANNRAPTPSATQGQKPADLTTPTAVPEHRGSNSQQDSPQQAANGPQAIHVILPAKDNYDFVAFWISIVLAGVGIAGVIVGVCTLLFLKAQVIEMRRQAALMKTEAGHMSDQTGILRDSVAAAQTSADAALAQIRLVKDKERARIRIEFLDFDFGPFPEIGKHTVMYKVTIDGTTPATIMEQVILAEIPSYPRETGKFHFSLGLPGSFSPTMSPFTTSTVVFRNEFPPKPEDDMERIRAVQENLLAVVVQGHVLYRDIFGDCWKLGFHLRWRNNSFFDIEAPGGVWEWLGDNDNGEKKIDR
jgi:hypothetical protein